MKKYVFITNKEKGVGVDADGNKYTVRADGEIFDAKGNHVLTEDEWLASDRFTEVWLSGDETKVPDYFSVLTKPLDISWEANSMAYKSDDKEIDLYAETDGRKTKEFEAFAEEHAKEVGLEKDDISRAILKSVGTSNPSCTTPEMEAVQRLWVMFGIEGDELEYADLKEKILQQAKEQDIPKEALCFYWD